VPSAQTLKQKDIKLQPEDISARKSRREKIYEKRCGHEKAAKFQDLVQCRPRNLFQSEVKDERDFG